MVLQLAHLRAGDIDIAGRGELRTGESDRSASVCNGLTERLGGRSPGAFGQDEPGQRGIASPHGGGHLIDGRRGSGPRGIVSHQYRAGTAQGDQEATDPAGGQDLSLIHI